MKFSKIVSSCMEVFKTENGQTFVPYITGKPGGGKSACAREIAKRLMELYAIPPERVVEFNPSLREAPDILGLPDLSGDCTRWVPPKEFYDLRFGVGPAVLIIEELADAGMDLQNPLCRIVLDRYAGGLRLTDKLFIVATGNRTEDRSGAQRLSTKLGNRMCEIPFEENLDDWIEWAEEHGMPAELRVFMKWRPDLLSDFDAKRTKNPTPRSWAGVGMLPRSLPSTDFYALCTGLVGDGAAAEYCGFLRLVDKLPDIEEIIKHPDKAEVPTASDVLFAITAKIASSVNARNFGKLMKFITRLPKEFQVKCVYECSRSCKSVMGTREFTQFAVENKSLLLGETE